MNIDNPTHDDVVEVATIGGAALLLAGTGLSVYTGVLEVPLAAEIVAVGLAALGMHEGGRRRGKKSALIKWGLNELDELAEQQGVQKRASPEDVGVDYVPTQARRNESAPERGKARVSETSDSDPRTDSGQTGTPASAEVSPAEQAQRRVNNASYSELRQVAARVPGARGSGEDNTTERMESDLAAADSETVLAAFRSLSDEHK